MPLIFSDHAWDDYLYWQRTNSQILKRIHQLLEDIRRNPFEGIGKPEPLKHAFSGYWSRRIDQEHRLIYKPTKEGILLAGMRYHY